MSLEKLSLVYRHRLSANILASILQGKKAVSSAEAFKGFPKAFREANVSSKNMAK